MGRRGPQPEPTAIRLVKGNPGRRPINNQEPQFKAPEAGAPVPERLKKTHPAAAAEWTEKYDELICSGVLRSVDVKHFEDYCAIYGELISYEELTDKVGPEAAIRLGYQGQKTKLRADVLKYRDRLGLNPSARSGVKAVETKQESKISKYIAKG